MDNWALKHVADSDNPELMSFLQLAKTITETVGAENVAKTIREMETHIPSRRIQRL
jgi:hypothetical protein